MLATITLTDEQQAAVRGIKEWYRKGTKQTCVLSGFAGTGKTFLVKHIIEELSEFGIDKRTVVFAAFTGKASLLLKQANPDYSCSTIHHLAYNLEEEGNNLKFVLKNKSELDGIKLIIIDEASMLNQSMYNDLLTFEIPILLIGDEGQLPPIGGNFNVLDNPDFRLTKIHRQAEGNPIIHLSMLARERKKIEPGKYGNNAYVMFKENINPKQLDQICLRSDQVLCGYNSTRKKLNSKIRRLKGFTSPYPQIGDKLICTKNNWGKSIDDIALVNGLTGFVKRVEKCPKSKEIKHDCLSIDFQPDFLEDKTFNNILLLEGDFMNKKVKLSGEEYKKYDRMDFAEAITVHKAQGSCYQRLVVINEVLDSEEHHRWLYTAITRSSDKLILII